MAKDRKERAGSTATKAFDEVVGTVAVEKEGDTVAGQAYKDGADGCD